MKNVLKTLVLGFVLLTVFACSKDEETTSKIEGKWVYYKYGVFPDGIEKEEGYEEYSFDCRTGQNYKEIKEDGTYAEVSYDSECISTSHNATWTKDKKYITFKAPVGDVKDKYEILFLDNTTLKLKFIESCCISNRARITHYILKREDKSK